MKRVALTAIVLILGLVIAIIKPEALSTTNILAVLVAALVVLVISLVAMPVTEYITVEKWKEVAMSKSFRKSIGFFRNKQACFYLAGGEVLEGKLVGRSDSMNTFTVETEKGIYRVFPQAALYTIEAIDGSISPRFLTWDENPELTAAEA